MAVAGCINAYDCSGNLIRTLEQLQSSNIGVGVQYTAPNPLDDKKINYIKYTDKCGCTCTLTGENEILIYATNGVIKNLSLTNDDTNERVIVKWNDLFGSNRAYTMVRYKTGSYPTSITDGTLAVKETTQNQYSTNGYNVSGLTDGTTYYFTAFAVSQDGTTINMQSSSITTDFGYVPNANTLLYVPMKRDLLDHSGKGISLTNSGVVINTSVASMGVGYFNETYLDNTSFNIPNTFTLNVFVRFNENQYWKIITYLGAEWTNSYGLKLAVGESTRFQFGFTYLKVEDVYSGGTPTLNTWYLYTFVKNGNSNLLYINGVQKINRSMTYASSPGNGIHIGKMADNEKLRGYLSNYILENRVRTQTEITNYFNKYKSKYGL